MKKRFTEEAQIIAEIDRCHAKSKEWFTMAEEWDAEADQLFKEGERIEYAKELRELAKAKRTRAYNLVHKKAKYYGEKLSEFRTATIQGVVPDTSIER